MQNKNLKFRIFNYFFNGKEKIAQIDQKIYSQRKSSDSPRDFGLERTRKINSRTLSKNFEIV